MSAKLKRSIIYWLFLAPLSAQAHCDTLDGPVVAEASIQGLQPCRNAHSGAVRCDPWASASW